MKLKRLRCGIIHSICTINVKRSEAGPSSSLRCGRQTMRVGTQSQVMALGWFLLSLEITRCIFSVGHRSHRAFLRDLPLVYWG